MSHRRLRAFALAGLVLTALSPTSGFASSFEDGVRERIRERAESSHFGALAIDRERVIARDALRQFYVARGFDPAWIGNRCPNQRAEEIASLVGVAGDDGLDPGDYHHSTLETRLQKAKQECRRGKFSIPEAAELELLLTDALLLYGSHLIGGKVNPETLDGEWHAQRREVDLARVAGRAATGDVQAVLATLRPAIPDYTGLRSGLSRYRAILANGGWTPIAAGDSLKAGDSGTRVEALRQRLSAEGLLEPATGRDFDATVRQAVETFQKRHGLRATGDADALTLDALNVPADRRVRQLEVNLERWRWLPQDLGERHIRVNVPSYELTVHERDKVVLSARAIVGRHYRRTPVLSSEMRYLVINPSWSVPSTIATEDILPLLRKDPNYLKKKGMLLHQGWGTDAKTINPRSVDWKRVTKNSFKYRIEQRPGKSNALGKVKFMFPNKFGVYIHDTPTRDLFGEDERAFSSGCIRIEHPIKLAEYVLAPDKSWNPNRLARAFVSKREQTVHFPKPIPVHLLYATAWTDELGNVNFRPDLYGRDKLVASALAKGAPKSAP